MTIRQINHIYSAPNSHWVGNGFPVSTLFSYQENGEKHSPFLLMDYAEPTLFKPVTNARGVGAHPHRGFETVTIAYQGEVSHHDSKGHAGTITAGDVQWMTAASGILHKEYHSEKNDQRGWRIRNGATLGKPADSIQNDRASLSGAESRGYPSC
ncbi:pirin family protein [Proteus penneri ATCC 35198]|nr:pirin family protein [Proteus penneri ATCC 35198]